ncbi:MAG: hypothetical protein NZM44_05490, partial [Candidatus Calescibacterium sp.]|nr:hypothetical protein [Candidatus Calescibacterium sp.]
IKTLIGKVASFHGGYIYVRYRYNDFMKNNYYLNVGNFLVVLSVNNKYILSQIVDIYDVLIEKEENIRTSIANDGSITSTEVDIYLFVELKLKPVIEFDTKGLFPNGSMITTRLKEVFVFDKNIREHFYNIFFDSGRYFVKTIVSKDLPLYGLIFLIGIDNFLGIPKNNYVVLDNPRDSLIFHKNKIDKNQKRLKKVFNFSNISKVFFVNSSAFMSYSSYFIDIINNGGIVFVRIFNRIELLKLMNGYFNPDFILGRKLVKTDYDIISKLTMIRNDYLDNFFFSEVYVIHKGIIFHF